MRCITGKNDVDIEIDDFIECSKAAACGIIIFQVFSLNHDIKNIEHRSIRSFETSPYLGKNKTNGL